MHNPFDFLAQQEHEQLAYRYDKDTGLRAFIAIHNTVRGPSLGGTRLWHYDTVEAAALDALRLSEGMTYKAAVAGLPLGGGKAVILADGQENDPVIRAERFRAFGRFVDELGGRYITAEDVGTKPSDMIHIQAYTDHVVGIPADKGGSGDPSPMTAYGTLCGINALVEEVLDRENLQGLQIAIQGLGKVGLPLAKSLIEAGAIVTGSDVNPDSIQAAQSIGVSIVETDAIYDVPCDIFVPCALGAVINDNTIPRLTCKIIAGAANNQLEEPRHGEIIHEHGIVYAVDYVINSGGLINVATELEGYDETKARAKTSEVYHTIKQLLQISHDEGISTVKAAQVMAENRLNPMLA